MRICVSGAGGFIGGHLCKRLIAEGHWVRGVDIKSLKDWWQSSDLESIHACEDLREASSAHLVTLGIDWVFHLAADMGGMGHISKNHADIIVNNTLIDINVIEAAKRNKVKRLLYSSSACVYPVYLQDADCPPSLKESDVYPADPQLAYGWQKLHTEHICKHVQEAGWLDTRVARIHNCYGPFGSWRDGREKAPAALCRKVAVAKLTGQNSIEVWGDGQAVRSYMYIDDCLEGLTRLMNSNSFEPVNLGSSETVSVDSLARIIAEIAEVGLDITHIEGPQGVRSRSSDNTLCKKLLGFEPSISLKTGLTQTYEWIENETRAALAQGEKIQ